MRVPLVPDSRHPAPGTPMDDLADMLTADPVLAGQLHHRRLPSAIAAAHGPHVRFAQAALPGSTQLRDPLARVAARFMSAQHQVIWTHTGRIPAAMDDELARWDRAA